MKKKKIQAVAIIIFVFVVITLLSHLFFNNKDERKLSSISKAFTQIINESRPFDFFLEPYAKIVIQAPDSLILDDILFRMTAYSDNTFILADNVNKMFFLISNRGKILKTIGRMGKGPGEFMDITSFAISPNHFIYAYDRLQQRITVFDFNGEIKRIVKLKSFELGIRHLRVDRNEIMFIHHPPSNKFPAFITVIDSNGNCIKELRDKINWSYRNYYNRGYLDGDLLLTSDNHIIEANDFSGRIFIGDLNNNFVSTLNMPDYDAPPLITGDSPKEYINASEVMTVPLFFLSFHDSVFFQSYFRLKDKNSGTNSAFRIIDKEGNYLGIIETNMLLYPNMGDQNYVISASPNIENGHINQRVKYNIIIYTWKSIPDLLNKEISANNQDTSVIAEYKIAEKSLGKEARFIGVISQQDCNTCNEILLSGLIQIQGKLSSKRERVILIVVNSNISYFKNLKARYGGSLNIMHIDAPGDYSSPSFFYPDSNKFKSLTILPEHSSYLRFMDKINKILETM